MPGWGLMAAERCITVSKTSAGAGRRSSGKKRGFCPPGCGKRKETGELNGGVRGEGHATRPSRPVGSRTGHRRGDARTSQPALAGYQGPHPSLARAIPSSAASPRHPHLPPAHCCLPYAAFSFFSKKIKQSKPRSARGIRKITKPKQEPCIATRSESPRQALGCPHIPHRSSGGQK